MNTQSIKEQALEIRKLYHKLEEKYHHSKWSIQEDALAFLSDAGIVGRLVMDYQGRWPSESREILPSKIAECIWWLIILADRMNLDFQECLEDFLEKRLQVLRD